MRDDRPAAGGGPEPPDDVLVREAVEPVAPDPGVPESAGQRQAPGLLRHPVMEGRVEAYDLGQSREASAHRFDDGELAGQMQWSQGRELAERLHQARVQ